MNIFWNLFAILSMAAMVIQCSSGFNVSHHNKTLCEIDTYNKSVTVNNIRKNCNNAELRNIFSNLKAGTFPNGKYTGYAIQQNAVFDNWNGKTITYLGGTPPNDHGTVFNTVFKKYSRFKGTVYRHMVSFDGKEAFVLDYKQDILASSVVDYIREVQRNLYLGYSIIRPFYKSIVLFFLLELP